MGASTLTAVSTAIHRKGKLGAEELLKEQNCPFFFRHALPFFFGKQKWEGLLFSLSFTKHLLRIAYVLSAFFFLVDLELFHDTSKETSFTVANTHLVWVALIIIFSSLIVDFLFSLFSQIKPLISFRLLSPTCSCYLYLCTPLTAPFFRIMRHFFPRLSKDKSLSPTFKIRDKVYELLQETELGAYLDPTEQKFILSIVSFKERIAREVMVPRIDVFSMSDEILIEEAAELFSTERYSRIPVYKDSVDNIIGVLLYKDVLQFYNQKSEKFPLHLKTPIGKLVKPVLYTPETKKISQLLQEFRNKHIHLAIVVDEWGGTEGIVTIEDILEELVGEISDEYDTGQQSLFTRLPNGSWVVDAKMSIIDIQEELGINIPQSPEYDTLGGYIFNRAGSIPAKGWKIHHDDFDLEVLSSNDRAIAKIKITALYTK
jgi:putative hemolysin